MDTDEDRESEMEFWGGESPRSRFTSPNLDHEVAVESDSEGEEDDDDSVDDDMSNDAEDDEADDYNRMDIFGHR